MGQIEKKKTNKIIENIKKLRAVTYKNNLKKKKGGECQNEQNRI